MLYLAAKVDAVNFIIIILQKQKVTFVVSHMQSIICLGKVELFSCSVLYWYWLRIFHGLCYCYNIYDHKHILY